MFGWDVQILLQMALNSSLYLLTFKVDLKKKPEIEKF